MYPGLIKLLLTTYAVTNPASYDAVPWCNLQPSDTVNISPLPNDAVYSRKMDITFAGTSDAWITITGIPAPAPSGSDLSVGMTNNMVSSASYQFTPYDVNTALYVTGGTGFTPGWYQIISVSNGAATLATSPAASMTGGGVWNKPGHLPVFDG